MRAVGVAPLPPGRLSFTAVDGEIVPAWLGDRDRPWLRDLIAEAHSFVGRPFAELAQRWRQSGPDPRAGCRQASALHVLSDWLRAHAVGVARSAARWELFRLCAAGVTREQALTDVAARHAIAVCDLVATLYDDLPDRRRVRWPEPPPEPMRLALAANGALVRGILRRAASAELFVHGAARVVLKTAWLRGAVPTVDGEPHGPTKLVWPRAGRTAHSALPALVPLLPWVHRYRLRARCELPSASGDLVLSTGDPLPPGPEPRLFDSALERRFASDFGRLLPAWRLLREPTVLTGAHGLAFPDFELLPPAGGESWLCEIAGLRDRTALPAKVQLLARWVRLVLCLPQHEVDGDLRRHPRVVPFRKHVDVQRVRAVIGG
ncbi:MAG TPA: DUF790 family protein [Planctomycetota bacterium]